MFKMSLMMAPLIDDEGPPGLVPDESDDEDEEYTYDQATQIVKKRAVRKINVVRDDDDPLEDIPVNSVRVYPEPNARHAVNRDLPLLMLSVTLSKSKGHVIPAWLGLVFEWMKIRCEAGAAALERGGKQQNLHLQIILRMHVSEQDLDALKSELKTLVGWRRGDGSGVYCSVKEFSPGQTWAMMLGYIHKDQNQPHFGVRLHNIDETDVVQGVAEWQTAKLSYEDGKILVTRANMFYRLSTWRLNSKPESDDSVLDNITEMLNTRKYMVATALVTQHGAIRLSAAEAMWRLVKGVRPMRLQDTRDLFFAFQPYARPGAPVRGERYFDETSDAEAQQPSSPIVPTEGFLTTPPTDAPAAASDDVLTPFVRNLINKKARKTAGCSQEHSSIALRPDSPVSEDSGSHSSDRDFINDDVEVDADTDSDGDTCKPGPSARTTARPRRLLLEVSAVNDARGNAVWLNFVFAASGLRRPRYRRAAHLRVAQSLR